jgi:hypothetical protein
MLEALIKVCRAETDGLAMLQRILALILLPAFLLGCHNAPQAENTSYTPPQLTPSPAPGVYRVSGGIATPGQRPLAPGETVSMALASSLHDLSVHPPFTITLVRQCPEGKSRELIDVNHDGHLMEMKQDYVLRDGDELIMPKPPEAVTTAVSRPVDVPPRH